MKEQRHIAQEKQTLSVPAAARELCVSTGKVTDWVKSGELLGHNLASKRSGRPRYAIRRCDLEEFLRGRRVVPNGESATHKSRRRTNGNVKEFF
jgi:transposase